MTENSIKRDNACIYCEPRALNLREIQDRGFQAAHRRIELPDNMNDFQISTLENRKSG